MLAEYFYNGPGYTDNLLEKLSGYPSLMPLYYFVYVPNEYSRHYAACFVSVNDFITSDLTLTLNTLSNLNDGSTMAALGTSISPLYNLSFAFNVYGFFGQKDREYTMRGSGLVCDLMTTVNF